MIMQLSIPTMHYAAKFITTLATCLRYIKSLLLRAWSLIQRWGPNLLRNQAIGDSIMSTRTMLSTAQRARITLWFTRGKENIWRPRKNFNLFKRLKMWGSWTVSHPSCYGFWVSKWRTLRMRKHSEIYNLVFKMCSLVTLDVTTFWALFFTCSID